jgi:YbbR domain-containing protein
MYQPFRHLGLKVLAIALAALLWLTVAGEHVVERSVRVPIEFRNAPPQLEIVGDPPATVDLRLRGSSALLSRIAPGEIVVVLDLSSARPGSRLFHLRADEVRVPFGVEVAQVVPATLSLELEKTIRRTVPVLPATEGEPAPGFVIGRISSQPAMVEIEGPESRVKQVASATTEPVTVDGKRERVRDVVTVGVADSAVRLVQPQIAAVVVEVLPAPIERDIASVPIRYRNLGAGLRAQVIPSLARVTVRGQREALAEIRPDSIDAFVDLAGLGAGRYNLRVQADPAQDFGIGVITPAVVVVRINQQDPN